MSDEVFDSMTIKTKWGRKIVGKLIMKILKSKGIPATVIVDDLYVTTNENDILADVSIKFAIRRDVLEELLK